MGCGASTANGSGAAAAPAPAAKPAAGAAPAAKPAAAAAAKAQPWTTGTGIQFWVASASHRDPISVLGDSNCRKSDLKKVVVLFDSRHLGFNKDFVTAVRQKLFKHKERTHGAADWNAVDTAAGYDAGLKIRTLLITASPASTPAFCTAIEASIYGMAFLNTLCGSGWKGADTMLKVALADDFYADPDAVLYKLYGQYDDSGSAGKSSAWKAYCSSGKKGIDEIKALKAKFDKDIAAQKAYSYLAENAGLSMDECMAGMDNMANYIDKVIPSDANVATAHSTTRNMNMQQPIASLSDVVKNVSWPSNRRPVGFCMAEKAYNDYSPIFKRFDRPCINVSEAIPDGNAGNAAQVADQMIVNQVLNKKEGHHQRKPIVLVGPCEEVDDDRLARFNCLMDAMTANDQISGITVVVHATSYDNFVGKAKAGQVVSKALQQATLTICCLSDELERVVEMFLGPSNEAIVDSVRVCMIPFPGMNLVTTHNALGQEISEGGILTTEFMVGNPGTGKTGAHMQKMKDRMLPLNKFAATTTRQLVLSDMNGDKKVHRIRMARKYSYDLKPISLIIPSRVLAGLLNGMADTMAAEEMDGSALTNLAASYIRVAEGGSFSG